MTMSRSSSPLDPVAAFEQLRPRLFGIAYRMLGEVTEAQDLVQDAYLRWHQADHLAIATPEAWLVAVVTRMAIDRLRHRTAERETYAGPWLPEPIATDPASAPSYDVELSSDLSMALLVLLERLAPDERAAFLLRDVFGASYEEIAGVLERSEPAVRQVVHRARLRVRGERQRTPVAPETHAQLLHRFLSALATEDHEAMLSLFSSDATFVSDGGGKVSAARNILRGPERITKFLLGLERKVGHRTRHRIAILNGEPAIVTYADGHLFATTAFETDGVQIVGAFRVLNPDKLTHLATELGGTS